MNRSGPNMSCSRPGETRVYYYIDSDDKPFTEKLQIPVEQVTLADFKRILPPSACNYKYFFDTIDSHLGQTVKEHIKDDCSRLPALNGCVVGHLVSVATSDSNSHDSGSTRSSLALLPQRRAAPQRTSKNPFPQQEPQRYATVGRGRAQNVQSFQPTAKTNGGFETDSMVSVNCQSSYSDSEFDGSSRMSSITDATSIVHRQPRRKHRKMRTNPAMNRASSMSSITETTVPDNVVRVTLNVEANSLLGIRIDDELCVTSVMKGSIAYGRINVGDIILTINHIRVRDVGYENAKAVLRDAGRKPGQVTLVVQKCYSWPRSPMADSEFSGSQQSQPLVMDYEGILPIDPTEWVKQTNRMHQEFSYPPSVLDFDALRIPDYSHHHHARQPVELTASTEEMEVVRQMADRSTGLDIRDRMWLKIHIPNAFMGANLVKWLKDHVKDLEHGKAARKYASKLLASGYIRHTVGTKDFSEKAYYTFGDLPIADDFTNMTMINDDDIPDSVSQVAANRVYPDSHLPSYPGFGFAHNTPQRSVVRTGSGHSSGGSGYGSDRRQKSTIFEETDSQITEVFNPPTSRNLSTTPPGSVGNRQLFPPAVMPSTSRRQQDQFTGFP